MADKIIFKRLLPELQKAGYIERDADWFWFTEKGERVIAEMPYDDYKEFCDRRGDCYAV